MKRGFTLIEVLVTMAIITILAGIMIPSAWKLWESQEIQTTRDRMNALKLAMVGDKNLMQGGIRTSYGFVGDNGELPFGDLTALGGLTFLVDRPASGYPKWNGPYMSGFDPATYTADAWGQPFRYTLQNNLPGYGNRYLSGEIRSAGPDAIFDNSDDIHLALSDREVAPSYRVQGNFSFANLTGSPVKSASFRITFRDPEITDGETTIASGCKSSFMNFTTLFPSATDPLKLPIGKVTISSTLYKQPGCLGAGAGTSGQYDYFISDNLSSLLINLPPAVPAP